MQKKKTIKKGNPPISEAEEYKLLARKRIEQIVGKGKVISEILEEAESHAKQTCPLLVEGKTGVGKKEIIMYLHSISPRNHKDLVTVDCGTIHENLIESELFGSKIIKHCILITYKFGAILAYIKGK